MDGDVGALTLSDRYRDFLSAMPASTRAKLPLFWADGLLEGQAMEVPISHVVARETHELEKQRLWNKVWQVACREERISEVGDQYVYDICGKSYLVVRSAPGEIRAFPNSCLHRGRQLREYCGRAPEIRCGFHSFTWNLDGTLKLFPGMNEFADRDKDHWRLPECKVGTWGGFVFINPDPDAEPLEAFLGELPEHFARWNLEDRYTSAHVSKIVPCNWKIAQEAFMEAFHVTTTHPQVAAGQNNLNTKNDAFGNFSRAMSLLATPSPELGRDVATQEVVDALVDRLPDEPPILVVPEGVQPREFMAQSQRDRLRPIIGDVIDDSEITELVDIFYYTVFPNFHPWGAFNELMYVFKPNGDDHRTSIMEAFYLSPFKGERPPPAPITHLTIEQEFVDAPELGGLARVFDQDVFNMPKMQTGLESSATGVMRFTAVHELKIRHFYVLLQKWLGLD